MSGLDDNQKIGIKEFLRGKVDDWIANCNGDEFAARDLVGGANRNWSGTPLESIYRKHISLGKSEKAANKAAGVDLGWLFKTMLYEDKRKFSSRKKYVWHYRCVSRIYCGLQLIGKKYYRNVPDNL